MSSVDSRIVSMKFDNAQFEREANKTMGTLGKLDKSLQMTGAKTGIASLQDSISKVNFGTIEGGIDRVSKGFMAMSTIAITAISNLTSKVVNAGVQLAKSLTVDPINAGLKEYETNLNAIQTILANTSSKGSTLDDVNASLKELNDYSDKTIYNFSEMARNIGTFTAAGVDLKTSTNAIKGIANLAAVSGSNAQQASTAMYQLSQALASGRVSLMDWNSVVSAGMGGEVFKNSLKETARAHGVAIDSIIAKEGSFRESLQTGWLSSDILTETLSKFTGDMTAEQLKQMGYTEEQIAGILKMGETAVDAATKVKTFSQLISTLQETAGSGWAKTWELILGDFEEAKTLFTGIKNVLGGMISASADARNKMLEDWKKLGGRTVLIEGLKNAFDALMRIIKPIKDAFREIFPAKTGKQLYDLTVAFRDFTERLKLSDETMKNLKRTFAGIFAVISIFSQIVKGVIGVLASMISGLAGGGGGLLKITGSIGDFFVGIDSWLKQGDKLKNFFDILGQILKAPMKILSAFIGMFSSIFTGFDKSSTAVDRFGKRLSPFETLIQNISSAFDGLLSVLGKVGTALKPVKDAIFKAMEGFGEAIAKVFSGGNFNTLLDVFNTGFLGGLVFLVKRFFDRGGPFGNIFSDMFGQSGVRGVMESIKGVFGELTNTLTLMQTKIKADILLKIALAVGVLTLSIIALSFVDSARLASALGAITVAFGELLGGLKILELVSKNMNPAKMSGLALALILMSVALLIMSNAVKNLAELDWGQVTRGLLGLGGILIIITKAADTLEGKAGTLVKAGASLIVFSIGLKFLASALKDFADMSWSEIGSGLLGVAGSLTVISTVVRLIPKNMIMTSLSIMVLAIALKVLAGALSDFADLDWGEVGRGLTGMGGALLIIAGAMWLMPPNMLLTAASLIVVAFALKQLAGSISAMGAMSWDEIGRGLATLAGSLAILALGLLVMSGTVAGSIALMIAAAALIVLAEAINILGKMKVGQLVQGLLALAGIFLILGAAGYLLAPVVPVLILIGAALLAMGAGLALVGLGALLFISALSILAGISATAAAAIGLILSTIISKIPEAMTAFAEGIIKFADTISKGGPSFVAAMTTVLTSLAQSIINSVPMLQEAFMAIITGFLNAVIELAPKIGEALKIVILVGLDVLSKAVPAYVRAGIKILLGILNGIADNIYQVVTAATRIITEFLKALGDNAPKVADQGAKTIIAFINGISDAIDDNSEELGKAGGRLAASIIKGMVKGLAGGVTEIAKAAKEAAKSALTSAKDFLGINSPSKEFIKIGEGVGEGFSMGITSNTPMVEDSVETMGESAMEVMRKVIDQIYEAMSGDIDMTPVISPVLDLTQVQKDASRISDLVSVNPISAGVSYNKAESISASTMTSSSSDAERSGVVPATVVQFEQNNYSPKALSSVEIYRQTKNQLSLAKEALSV